MRDLAIAPPSIATTPGPAWLRWILAAAVAGIPAAAHAEDTSRAPVIGLAVGTWHTCALHADGAVSCWGANTQGQLGAPAAVTASAVPVRVPGIDDALGITANRSQTCVRRRDQTVACWGEIPPGTIVRQPVATPFTDVVQVAGRCVRTAARTVACITPAGQVVSVGDGRDAIDLAVREDAGCVLHAGGTVSCWFSPERPQRIAGVRDAIAVAITDEFACARLRGGLVTCWDWAIDVGVKTMRIEHHPRPPVQRPVRPRRVAGLRGAALLAGGVHQVCAATARDVRCWYRNGVATAVAGVGAVTALAVGWHGCAVRSGREIACWGMDDAGQVGNGWSAARTTPTRVPGITDAVEIQASYGPGSDSAHTCALRRDHTVACWGTVDDRATATPFVLPKTNAIARLGRGGLAMLIDDSGALSNTSPGGGYHYQLPPIVDASGDCVLARDGRVLCTFEHRPSNQYEGDAVAIPQLHDAVQIAVTRSRACARRRTGAITGFSERGTLTEVPTINDAIDLATSESTSCAVRADRSVWCWGPSNAFVMLGSPTTGGVLRDPIQIPGLANVAAVSLGDAHACALTTDRTVWCWGDNQLGQLGDGTTTARARPAPVPGLANVVQVSAGTHHTCALLDAGTVTCWGSTSHGEVGTYRTGDITPATTVMW